MTGRERVLRCLEFDRPDRVPRDLWTLPIAEIEHGPEAVAELHERWPSDIVRCPVGQQRQPPVVRGERYGRGVYHDEWGCVFDNLMEGVIGEVKHPIIESPDDLSNLRPPVELLDLDQQAIGGFCEQTDRFVITDAIARPWERLQFLRGSENAYMDLAEESAALGSLLDRIHAFNCERMQAWAATAVDGLWFMDDWGSQQALLIDPQQWRRLFKPMYGDYARIAHDAGKKILMHSDGHIGTIYEDLVEIGIDAINSQLFCMDIEQLGRRFAGRITFWGEIDRQAILPDPDPQRARDAVRRVVEALYRPEGGVIAQCEFGPAARAENIDAVFAAWQQVTDEP